MYRDWFRAISFCIASNASSFPAQSEQPCEWKE